MEKLEFVKLGLSKIIWVFLAPGNLLVLALLAGAFLSLSHKKASQHLGRWLCFDIALVLFFIGIFPVGDWMLLPLENRVHAAIPPHVDGIIMIGGDEDPHATAMRNQAVFLNPGGATSLLRNSRASSRRRSWSIAAARARPCSRSQA